MPTVPPLAADGDVDDVVQRLGDVMARFRMLAAQAVERLGAAVDLAPGQIAALLAVDEGAGNVSAVAQRCLTHVSNASRTLDSLVRAGLVDRERDPDDRRVVLLAVTPSGRERLAHLHRHRDEVVRRALADIPPPERAHLVDLVQRLVAGLESQVADDPPDATRDDAV